MSSERRRSILLLLAIVTLDAATPVGRGPAPALAAVQFNEEAKVTAGADGKQYDSFGTAVAVSGTTAIVGAYADDVGTLRPGAAYVFVRSGNAWTRQQRLTAADAANRDLFGASVGISGDTAIVGAWRSSSGFGAAYVFVRNGTTWTQQQKLDAPAHVTGDVCGYAVAISGNTAVLTCKNDGGVGAAYVFVRSGATWTLQGTLQAVSSAAGDFFGFSVAVTGDTVIVGAIGDKLGGAQGKGAATVFVRSGTTWALQQKLSAPDGVAFDNFGMSVALSGNTAVVGQVTADDDTNPLNQQAYVFVRSGTTWTYEDSLLASDGMKGDRFGISVAVSGDFALVGASNDDAGASATTNEGSVYLFSRTDGAWTQLDKLTASDEASGSAATGNLFGFSVGLSGAAAIIGAPNFNIGANVYQGQAYAFVNPDSDGDALPDEWETKGVTIDGVFIDLPKMGANPNHKDLFVHADWMHADPLNPSAIFKPSARALKIVSDAFAIAPVTNPDGKIGVNLHVDLGPNSIMNPKKNATWDALSHAGEIPYQETLGSLDGGGNFVWSAIDTIKATHFTPAKRAAVFHYALFANDYAGADTSSGLSRGLGATDFFVTLGKWTPRGGTVMQQAGTFMHELGHNLGLHHGGDDDVSHKPNYLSIMNYTFQTVGLLPSVKQRRFDYSLHLLDPLDETNLDETVGINHPLHYLTLWSRLSRPTLPPGSNKCVSNDAYNRIFLPTGGLDWDCDGVKSASPVAADINRDGDCILPGPNGVNDTALGGVAIDDDPRADILWTGPNRQCDNTAAGDDVQHHELMYVEPAVLTGFRDWSHLDFAGGGALGSTSGVSSPPATTPIDEPTMEQILDASPTSLQDEELVAPLDEVTVSVEEGPAPLLVQFDGSASTAVGATVEDWSWDFGDGTSGSGATAEHTYATPGEYFASLTVTDSAGRVNLVPLLQLITVTEGGGSTPAALDYFLLYATAPSKGGAKFRKFGPVVLADGLSAGGFDVQKPVGLALPADTNGSGIVDATTDLSAYALKPSKGAPKLGRHANLRVASACGETVVTLAKPTMLLVPSALDANTPPRAPTDPDLDHFLCYQAKPQKKDGVGAPVAPFPKGVQADVIGQFETKRYDLKKIVALCAPVDKSGNPVLLSGSSKGTPVPITPATVRHADAYLLCHRAAIAKKRITQGGCGPATPGDKGTAITPPQAKHAPRIGLHVADQLGAGQLDTKKATLLCFPATLP